MSLVAAIRRCGWIARGTLYRYSTTTTAANGLKSVDQLPGPKAWPLIGNIPEMIKNYTKTREESLYHQWHLKYGPIFQMRGVGNQLTVVISDPESAAEMFRAEGKYPSRAHVEKNLTWIYKKNNLPSPMFFADGAEWKRIRSAAAKQVIPRRVGNFVSPLNEIADDFLQYVAGIRNKEGYVEDIKIVMDKFAFQGVAYFVFSERLNVYDDTDPVLKEFREAALDFIGNLAKIAMALPLYKIYPTKAYRDYLNGVNRMQSFGRKIIKEKHKSLKEAIEKGTVDETKPMGLMDQWLIEGKYTEEEALMQCCDMLSAGIDTTANTSSFMLHEVAKHPDLQDKLYHEITTVLGERKYPTFDDLQKMPLVRNTVKETLRMYPAIQALPRVIEHSIEMHGYRIPAKTPVMVTSYTASYNPEYMEDPKTFKPKRWNRESSELNAFVSLPFGFGTRSCYGRRLAEIELYILLSRMTMQFKISTDQHSLKTYQSTVQKPAEPVRIKLEERL